tara:strand:- start:2244 stop:2471 length:228 start_codon:yes stop_codon:yes gene_type:complete
METLTEISTSEEGENAFDVLMRCKKFASQIDLANIILDNTCIDEKEMLINLIESIRNLELEIIEIEVPIIPEAKA